MLQRMKGCQYLEHLRHTFEDDDRMTFDACQASLLRKLARDKDEECSMSAKLLGLTVQQTPSTSYPRDNAFDQYQGNSATQTAQYASQTSTQRDDTMGRFESNPAAYEGGFQGPTAATYSQTRVEMRRCYSCNQFGHFQSACPHAGFSSGQPSQQGRGYQGQQLGRGNFGQSQGRGNQGGFQGRVNSGQLSGKGTPRQQHDRGTQGGYQGRGNSSQPTFAQFTQWKQQQPQGREQQPLTGNKRSPYERNQPGPN